MKTTEFEVQVFKAFCDENRLRILQLLRSGEMCACNLQDVLTISQSTLSHHMKILLESGLVASRKSGKWTYYHLCPEGTNKAEELISFYLEVPNEASASCSCEENQQKNAHHTS